MTYWTAVDPGGDMCLWSGTGPGDPNCQPVANKRLLDRDDTALWPILVAGLVPDPTRPPTIELTKRVRYAFKGESWEGWLVTLTPTEHKTQATVRRDSDGENWVVLAENITEIPAP